MSKYAVTSNRPDVPESNPTDSNVDEPDITEREVAEPGETKPEAAAPEVVEPEAAKPDEAEADDAEPDEVKKPTSKSSRQATVSVRSLVVAAVVAAVIAAFGVLGWLYIGAERKLGADARESENIAHAEKVALDYAVNAAAMNYQDMNGWKAKLVSGTTPELNDKLSKAATSIEQILMPLQWTSTAKPLAAKVRSHTGASYVVDAFVTVMTKTVQAPDALQSTATYSVTIDSGNGWKISDVGGVGAAVEGN